MTITVEELLSITNLRTKVFAGNSGLHRQVGWAHVCELPEPTEYLAAGELLMTVGYTVPEGPSAQKLYVSRLIEAGLSGLLIAEQMHAPELSAELKSAADRCSFPILLTAYDVPFTAISRAVAEANRNAEHTRLLQAIRVYETARVAVGKVSSAELMSQLGDVARCDLFVLDPYSGHSLLLGAPPASANIVAALTEEMSRRSHPMPALLRLAAEPYAIVALFVPASRPATLVAVSREEEPLDLSVLRHVATVGALEVEKRVADHERRRRLGAELLASLVDGRVDADSASHLLTEWELAEEPRIIASCAADGVKGAHNDLHLRLGDRGLPHLLLRRAQRLTALLPDTPNTISVFCEEVGPSCSVGLSASLGGTSRLPDAYREACWALEGAKAADKPVVKYGDESPSPFLPRSLSESQRAVEHVLGPLLQYDATHNSQFVKTLRVFLGQNRSWQKAADDLHVHKQTLVYRLHRIEELTGRSLGKSKDLAEIWLALQAAEAADLLGGKR